MVELFDDRQQMALRASRLQRFRLFLEDTRGVLSSQVRVERSEVRALLTRIFRDRIGPWSGRN
jgi:hypothetical protein